MRKKREQGGCGRTKQVDREMPRVQRCEFDRYESVEHLVRSHHGQRDRGHRAFGSAPAPGRIAKSNQQESEEKCHARSEEHTSELQSLMRISYAVFCLKKKKKQTHKNDKKNK